jgi:N-acyl homoserine lactone hydrolase
VNAPAFAHWTTGGSNHGPSLDRFKKIAEALKATVIIQHDMRAIGKLPAFPSAAK